MDMFHYFVVPLLSAVLFFDYDNSNIFANRSIEVWMHANKRSASH